MAEKLSRQVERIKSEIKEYELAIDVLENHNDSIDEAELMVSRQPIRTLSDAKRKLEQKL